jgi:AbiV family abortive infection protein
MAKKFNFYRGTLSAMQAATGMNAAKANAKRLLEDAELLFEAKRFPSACALGILSIEEAGKLPILREIACMKGANALREAWQRYSDHRQKNTAWLAVKLIIMDGARTLNEIKQSFDPNSLHPDILNLMKQTGFYTDAYGEAEWSEPNIVIDENTAKTVLMIAKALLPKRETTEREMQLWIEHLSTHWGKPDMETRVIALEEALLKEGFRNVPMEEIRTFYGVRGQVKH